jgi:hypothetical protein
MKFQVPRLVNDHKGSKDNLEAIFSAKDGGESLLIKRNGAIVVRSESFPGVAEPAVEVIEYLGGIESHFAVLGSTAFARDLLRQASNKPEAKSTTFQCGKADHGINCKHGKFVLGAGALIGGAGVGALVGGPVGAAVGLAYGLFALAIDTYIDCQRPDEFDRCERSRCDCRERSGATTRKCEDDMNGCCQSAGGRVIQWAGDTYCHG